MEELVSRVNKVVFQDGDTIVKVFNEAKPVSDVFNEALNLARANEAGINTPKPVSVAKIEDSWALTTSRIPGKTLQELMDENPEKIEKYLMMFVDFQIDIHAHRAPLLQRQKDKYSRMIASLTDVLDATTRYELDMRLDGMPNEVDVCHGDFNPSNVIVGDDGELYACDWAHATQGSAAADAAISYMLFEMEDHELAQKYLDLYCKKSDTPRQVVHNWLSIVAAAELSRGREKDYDFMMSWIDVVDYQ